MTDLDGIEPNADAASRRVTFQLTYARATQPRTFQPGLLGGPPIPCAYDADPLGQPGDWYDSSEDPGSNPARTEDQWVDRYASSAVQEAVHEALEWFRVDGQPWLDPHGDAEDAVHEAVGVLCARLAEIRRTAQKAASRSIAD